MLLPAVALRPFSSPSSSTGWHSRGTPTSTLFVGPVPSSDDSLLAHYHSLGDSLHSHHRTPSLSSSSSSSSSSSLAAPATAAHASAAAGPGAATLALAAALNGEAQLTAPPRGGFPKFPSRASLSTSTALLHSNSGLNTHALAQAQQQQTQHRLPGGFVIGAPLSQLRAVAAAAPATAGLASNAATAANRPNADGSESASTSPSPQPSLFKHRWFGPYLASATVLSRTHTAAAAAVATAAVRADPSSTTGTATFTSSSSGSNSSGNTGGGGGGGGGAPARSDTRSSSSSSSSSVTATAPAAVTPASGPARAAPLLGAAGAPALTPREVVAALDSYVIGQSAAKRAVAIALRNRWRRRLLPEAMQTDVVPKNILMIGPTGCGKTEIARRLAKLAGAPFVKVEATKFTETGFHGRDVETIIKDLAEAGVALIKQQRQQAALQRARAEAHDFVLSRLFAPDADAETRSAYRGFLEAGELDNATVELELPVRDLRELHSAAALASASHSSSGGGSVEGGGAPTPGLQATLSAAEATAMMTAHAHAKQRAAAAAAAAAATASAAPASASVGNGNGGWSLFSGHTGATTTTSSTAAASSSPSQLSQSSLLQTQSPLLSTAPSLGYRAPGYSSAAAGSTGGGSPLVRRVLVSVREARRAFESAAGEALVAAAANEDVTMEAMRAVEESGVVFIDEIDKVCVAPDANRTGADASDEGVQRDLLPIIEGSVVSTPHGNVKTDHILFIASGAFHKVKPSALLPELQGRLPIRVTLEALTERELYRVLTEPVHNLLAQQSALVATEGVALRFQDEAVAQMARTAAELNKSLENIGARRLHAVVECVVEELSFSAPEMGPGAILTVTAEMVKEKTSKMFAKHDLQRYIL